MSWAHVRRAAGRGDAHDNVAQLPIGAPQVGGRATTASRPRRAENKERTKGFFNQKAGRHFTDVNPTLYKWPELYHAIASGRVDDAVEFLDERPLITNQPDDYVHGYTPLLWAASCNRQQIVIYLVNNGADLDSVTKNGQTALHLAAKQGNLAMVRTLVEAGCSIDHRDGSGRAALHSAAECCRREVIQYLVMEAAADIFATNAQGSTCRYIVQRTTWDDVDENFRAAVLFEQAQASARAFLLRVESLPPLWTRGTHNLGGQRVNVFVKTMLCIMLRSAWAEPGDAIYELPHLPYEIWIMILLRMPRSHMKLATTPPECDVIPPPMERASLRSRRGRRTSSTGSLAGTTAPFGSRAGSGAGRSSSTSSIRGLGSSLGRPGRSASSPDDDRRSSTPSLPPI